VVLLLGDWQGVTAEDYRSDKAGIAQMTMKHLGGRSTDDVMSATKAIKVFQRCCGTNDDDAIADLICDLGHLADERGLDFLSEVRRGIGYWYAERHAREGDALGPNAYVDVAVKPRMVEW
jgi:hypothetical protein